MVTSPSNSSVTIMCAGPYSYCMTASDGVDHTTGASVHHLCIGWRVRVVGPVNVSLPALPLLYADLTASDRTEPRFRRRPQTHANIDSEYSSLLGAGKVAYDRSQNVTPVSPCTYAVLCGCRKESGEVVQSKTRCETVTSSFYEADYSESWKVAELKLRYSGDNAQESAGQLS